MARTWRLAPALLAREQPVELSFLRLASPELLFSGVVPPATPLVTTIHAFGSGTVVVEETGAVPAETAASAEDLAVEPDHEEEAGVPDNVAPGITDRIGNATPAEPSERDQARDWLSQQGPAGDVLIALAEALAENRLTADARPSLIQNKVFLPYPQAMAGWRASPGEVLEALVVRDWIERDPLRPMLKVREHDGVSGVWLRRAVSRRLVALGLGVDSVPSRSPETIQPPSAANEATVGDDPPNRTRAKGFPATAATAYARTIRQRLLARDPTLGPITERPGALAIPLRGPILDGARRAGLSETALRRALERLPNARPVEKGLLTLGL